MKNFNNTSTNNQTNLKRQAPNNKPFGHLVFGIWNLTYSPCPLCDICFLWFHFSFSFFMKLLAVPGGGKCKGITSLKEHNPFLYFEVSYCAYFILSPNKKGAFKRPFFFQVSGFKT
jgi:hypothetical protein